MDVPDRVETERLILRPHALDDYEPAYAMWSDPEVVRFIGGRPATREEVWHRLLNTHVPDAAGKCRACTAGGTGIPREPWPCVIRGMAELARISHSAGAA